MCLHSAAHALGTSLLQRFQRSEGSVQILCTNQSHLSQQPVVIARISPLAQWTICQTYKEVLREKNTTVKWRMSPYLCQSLLLKGQPTSSLPLLSAYKPVDLSTRLLTSLFDSEKARICWRSKRLRRTSVENAISAGNGHSDPQQGSSTLSARPNPLPFTAAQIVFAGPTKSQFLH